MKHLIAILLALAAGTAHARDPAQVRAFRKTHACPATGKLGMGACPGWRVNHGLPLCAGGADLPRNMFWQSLADSLLSDAEERKVCAQLKRCTP